IIGEDRARFEKPVAVFVFEDADAPLWRLALGGPVGIITHLHDPELAVLIERHGDGAFELRLARDQLDAQSGRKLEMLDGLLRRQRTVDAALLRRFARVRRGSIDSAPHYQPNKQQFVHRRAHVYGQAQARVGCHAFAGLARSRVSCGITAKACGPCKLRMPSPWLFGVRSRCKPAAKAWHPALTRFLFLKVNT